MYLYSIINYYEELREYLEVTVPVFAGFILKVLFAILVYWVGARIIDTNDTLNEYVVEGLNQVDGVFKVRVLK